MLVFAIEQCNLVLCRWLTRSIAAGQANHIGSKSHLPYRRAGRRNRPFCFQRKRLSTFGGTEANSNASTLSTYPTQVAVKMPQLVPLVAAARLSSSPFIISANHLRQSSIRHSHHPPLQRASFHHQTSPAPQTERNKLSTTL
ncbi:hypothetical protein COCVIDRAFT_17139 [Bipolaris victoriae FI3]|uniref:Uncharacterized protein n=1 Tax=Bipolaris victoriae (strain FI3) TaxID=930091 RepID=W7EIS6_BIPV3|nr:hypothetical protein COCVIDRAFT_17139 [Bipolaris victoriae FI3]